MSEEIRKERSPGIKLLFASLIGMALMIPLLLVYALIWDRQHQSRTAQEAINAGWGGPQVIAGPVLAVPYRATETQNEVVNGRTTTRIVEVERTLFVSPLINRIMTGIRPEMRRKSIYSSVLFEADVKGEAIFALPEDLPRFGVEPEQLFWNRAELRMGASDARGLVKGGAITANGEALSVQPGKGPNATSREGFFAFLPWDGEGTLTVEYAFGLRGSGSLSLVPRGGRTEWNVSSSWQSPSFSGDFLPETREMTDSGFMANYSVDKLALGNAVVMTEDLGPPAIDGAAFYPQRPGPMIEVEPVSGQAHAITVGLIEPVDLYSKVDRAVKYGFLFIGFSFLAFLLFDIVGGARVAPAEYLMIGAGLVLFFVLLLAFAEVIGFTAAYLVASAAMIGLLTAYSVAVLGSRRRAGFIGALLVGLYALLFVLLNLEAYSLLIGSLLLFGALAGVMYVTRNIDWGSVGAREARSGNPGL